MQYNNISNMRVPLNYKKPMAFSQFLNTDNYQPYPLTKKQSTNQQKYQPKDTSHAPTFLHNKRSDTVHQSMIFNNPYSNNPSPFQNPFLTPQETNDSVQNQNKKKDQLPSFLKNDSKNSKEQAFNQIKFANKNKSPEPLHLVERLVSGEQSLKNYRNSKKGSESGNQIFSPIHPKRIFTGPFYSPNVNLENKEFSDQQKQKNPKSDQKSTMNLSQKSTKVPEFLKKGSPINKNRKQPESQKLKTSEGLFELRKVNTDIFTQSESPRQRKSSGFQPKYSGFKNYVETQSTFSKKKPNDFTSASFTKISNTPQNNPIRGEYANFQFGRLSSPSSLLNRRRVDTTHPTKEFSLKDFQLVDKIGKGAFGDVFIARQKLVGFLCVLKKMSKKKIKELKIEDSILREIKIQSFLKHKHLTSLYGFFDDEEYVYLILQILPDGSMSQIKKKRKIPEMQVSKYLRQVCEGLRYMHKQEVIHRDLKPENILMNQEYLKIGDFGCAIYTQTLRKTIVGCLAYISPEQLNNESYDEKIDAWSVGILTYELVAGKAPFEESLSKKPIHQLESNILKLQFPADLHLSEDCKAFISNLLALNPNDRMTIDETMKHPFITKGLQQDRKDEQQVFGIYQSL